MSERREDYHIETRLIHGARCATTTATSHRAS